MLRYRLLGAGLAVLAFFSLMSIGSTALAAYSTLDSTIQPRAIADPGWVRVAETKAKTEQPVKKEPEKKAEKGFISKTFDKLMGDDKGKAEKPADKKAEKEEPGLLTKALKKLVGGDEDKAEKKTKHNPLNPVPAAPTVSASQNKEVKKTKTATVKSETKATLKSSLKTLIGVDAAKAKAKEKAAEPATQSARQEKAGATSTLKKYLGGGDKKDKAPSPDTRQVKQDAPAPAKPVQAKPEPVEAIQASGSARQDMGEPTSEEEQLNADRGGVKKGGNILKESFKSLVKE